MLRPVLAIMNSVCWEMSLNLGWFHEVEESESVSLLFFHICCILVIFWLLVVLNALAMLRMDGGWTDSFTMQGAPGQVVSGLANSFLMFFVNITFGLF